MTLAGRLLEHYIAAHNEGVMSGDFRPVVELFAVTGELRFEGIALEPCHGREEIADAFAKYPPSNVLVLSSITGDGNEATAAYAKTAKPDELLGALALTAEGDKIHRLTIKVGAR